jgi:hypothetical protein
MDQNTTNNESAPFVLPEVHPEELANGVNPQEVVANTHEEQSMAKAIEGGTLGASNSAAPAAQVQQDFVDPSMFVAPAPAPAQTQGTPKQIKVVTDDLHAADNDLIEKAWVVKAKAISNRQKMIHTNKQTK